MLGLPYLILLRFVWLNFLSVNLYAKCYCSRLTKGKQKICGFLFSIILIFTDYIFTKPYLARLGWAVTIS